LISGQNKKSLLQEKFDIEKLSRTRPSVKSLIARLCRYIDASYRRISGTFYSGPVAFINLGGRFVPITIDRGCDHLLLHPGLIP